MVSTTRKLTLKSPAKINLGLRIVRKREDGFHDIETVFQMISIYDILTFRIIDSGVVFKTNHKKLPLDDTNLVVKAAKLILQETKFKKGVEIFLEKTIPVGAGLGGGSSNAASTIIGLKDLCQLNLKKKDLIKFAMKLGSDVPFFLSGPTAFGRGRGEILTPLKIRVGIFVVVVFPNIFIHTGSVYKELNLGLTSNSKDNNILGLLLKEGEIADFGNHLFNDLETIVCKKYPILLKIKKALIRLGAVSALVSGSGSSVFGLFAQSESAQKAAAKLRKKNWQVFFAKTINNY